MYKHSSTIAATFAMFLLILDAKTALAGAREGLSLCIETVIPTLFPFSVLTTYLCSHLSRGALSLRPLEKLCRIPHGFGHILLLGFLGGYPMGIQCVCQAYQGGTLAKPDAQRMIGFCSNAGVAFIFGMAGGLFPSILYPAGMLVIVMGSAVLTGILLPGDPHCLRDPAQTYPISLQKCAENGIFSMGRICAWVILFRIILSFSGRWFLFLFPKEMQSIFSGILELTSGVLSLPAFPLGIRFMLASVYMSFGGICVLMQSHSFTEAAGLDSHMYLPGKLLQSMISFLLSYLFQLVFVDEPVLINGFLLLSICAFLLFFTVFLKKHVEIKYRMLYNTKRNGGNAHVISETDTKTVPVLRAVR